MEAANQKPAPKIVNKILPGFVAQGIEVAVGTTGTGKTYLLYQELKKLARTRPAVLIDSIGAENFLLFPHAKSLADVGNQLRAWKPGTIIYWTPDGIEDFDAFFNALLAVQKAGKASPIAVLVDEVSAWTMETRSKALRKICRVWRHAKLTLLITSQHVSADLGQVMLACNPLFYLFRTTSPRSLDWIEDNVRIPRESIEALPDRHWFEIRI